MDRAVIPSISADEQVGKEAAHVLCTVGGSSLCYARSFCLGLTSISGLFRTWSTLQARTGIMLHSYA